MEWILAFTQQPPKQLPGMTLSAERSGDDTGVVIRVSAVRQKAFHAGSQKGWDGNVRVSAGRKVLLSSSGGSSYDYGQQPEAYQDLARALNDALSRPPDEPLEALVTVVEEE